MEVVKISRRVTRSEAARTGELLTSPLSSLLRRRSSMEVSSQAALAHPEMAINSASSGTSELVGQSAEDVKEEEG